MQARAVRTNSGGLLLRACIPRHSGPFHEIGRPYGMHKKKQNIVDHKDEVRKPVSMAMATHKSPIQSMSSNWMYYVYLYII